MNARERAAAFPRGPSDRHVMRVVYQDPKTGNFTEHCARCGCHFNAFADGSAPVWCMPSRAWLDAHPDDDGRWRSGPRSPLEPAARSA